MNPNYPNTEIATRDARIGLADPQSAAALVQRLLAWVDNFLPLFKEILVFINKNSPKSPVSAIVTPLLQRFKSNQKASTPLLPSLLGGAAIALINTRLVYQLTNKFVRTWNTTAKKPTVLGRLIHAVVAATAVAAIELRAVDAADETVGATKCPLFGVKKQDDNVLTITGTGSSLFPLPQDGDTVKVSDENNAGGNSVTGTGIFNSLTDPSDPTVTGTVTFDSTKDVPDFTGIECVIFSDPTQIVDEVEPNAKITNVDGQVATIAMNDNSDLESCETYYVQKTGSLGQPAYPVSNQPNQIEFPSNIKPFTIGDIKITCQNSFGNGTIGNIGGKRRR